MIYLLNTIHKYAGPLLIIWWVLSFTATHMPLPENTGGLPYVDKVVHIIIYMTLAFLLSLWWSKKTDINRQQIISIFFILLLYAVIDESLQAFINRNPSIKDVAADTVGIIIGLFIFLKWRKYQ